MPDIRSWSITAALNDAADALINWLEGQLPSTVNNSARAMMAAIRGTFEGPDSKYNGLEYWDFGITPTRTGASTFTLPTVDYTAAFVEGRRLRFTDASTVYGTVVSSSFGAGVTTVTMAMDGASVLSASLTKVFLSPQMPTNTSAPTIFGKNDYALTTGTSSAYIAAYTPKPPNLANGMVVRVRLHAACAATPTFTPHDGVITAKTIVQPGNVAVAANDLSADSVLALTYVQAIDRWVIVGRPLPTSVTAFTIKTGDYTMVVGDRILADMTGGAWALTLPPTPAAGNTVEFIKYGSSVLTIGRNGEKIENIADDGFIDAADGAHLKMTYLNATYGWVYGRRA